uniref:A-kinase anchor protein 10, mitochondrial-like n=1 Tax=Saccoglossus kowalevskii TaxID=10224 RepID=A0ABM0M9C1_SACKO|nr:PREDICTED: A-kinase anchor protein 10, mitochondrial-like [Saccoglossus kowalevskii]
MPFFKRKSEKTNDGSVKQGNNKNKHPVKNTPPSSNTPSPVHHPSNSQHMANGIQSRVISDGADISSVGARPKVPLLRDRSKQETSVGDLGIGYESPTRSSVQKSKSRLSKPLQEVLYDSHGALPYLIQFMSAQGCPQLVQFWLSAESFGSATWTKLRAESLHSVSKSTVSNSSDVKVQQLESILSNKHKEHAASEKNVGNSHNSETTEQNSTDPGSGTELAQKLRESSLSRCTDSSTSCNSDTNHNLNKDIISSVSCEDKSAAKLKKAIESDAVNIFTRYLGQDAPNPIGIPDDLRLEVIRKICMEDGQVDPNCFVPVQHFVQKHIQENYFDAFLQSDFHCKYQVDVLTSGSVYLTDILYNQTAMFYFMEYAEQEGCIDLLQYFSLQATNPVGFSDAVRFEVECNICREGGPLPDCFSTSLRIAHNTLEKVYLKSYFTSEMYLKYLNELIHQIKNEQVEPSPHTRRKRHPSESSSENSNGSFKDGKNTLLADGTVKKVAEKVESGNFRIDTGNFDPDALWQRPSANMMSFGKVNEFGQFIAECEPDPEVKKNKTSKLDKVKQWVTGNEDQVQEEMAWQVAQMIINDVSKQTLGLDEDDDEDEDDEEEIDVSDSDDELSEEATGNTQEKSSNSSGKEQRKRIN